MYSVLSANWQLSFIIISNDSKAVPGATQTDNVIIDGINVDYLRTATVTFSISTVEDISSLAVFSNNTHTMVLVPRSFLAVSPYLDPLPTPSQVQVVDTPKKYESISPEIQKTAEKITTLSKASVASIGGAAMVSGAACSLNLGPAFIKLFQIIEILGKFYFMPIDYSELIDYFLSKIFDLSDIIDIRKDYFLPEQRTHPNTFYNKLSKEEQQRHLLRSSGVFVIVYLGLRILDIMCQVVLNNSRKRSVRTKIRSFVSNLRSFFFEMSYIDFAFYSSYALLGPTDTNLLLTDKWYFLNKIIALILLTECTVFACNVFMAVNTDDKDEKTKRISEGGTQSCRKS